MTSEQKSRLAAFLPKMKAAAQSKVTQNDYRKAMFEYYEAVEFLSGRVSQKTADEWISIAEKAARQKKEEQC